jgi:hypothetical protein
LIEILTPKELAPKCYLFEALYWIAFNRYPIVENYDEHGNDYRFNEESFFDFEVPIETDLTLEECERIGLPPDPKAIDDYFLEPDKIRELQNIIKDQKDKLDLERKLVISIKYYDELKIWELGFEDFIEIYKSKLFIALKEGKLEGWGLKGCCYPEDETADTDEEERVYVKIPPSSWRLSETNWSDCSLIDETTGSLYNLIPLDTEKLLKLFPGSKPEAATNVMVLAGQYILDNGQKLNPRRSSNKGRRPSLDWDKVHVEIARRFKIDHLPDKQEAFIAEMEAWCIKEFNHKPGRSTLLQKISPYYKLKKSENNAD